MQLVACGEGTSRAVFAEFTHDAALVRLYGEPEAVARVRQAGILEKTDWSLQAAGVNAAAVGLAERRQMQSVAEQHTLALLRQFAVYFAPILFAPVDLDPEPEQEPRPIGGIAVIVPAQQANADYLMLAASIAATVLYRCNSAARARVYQSMLNPARISFYLTQKDGGTEIIISHAPERFFQMLGLDGMDCSMRPLSVLIDPKPENEDLWSILQSRSSVDNLETELRIHGKTLRCTLSAHFYDQPALHLAGGYLFLTTPQWISSVISSQVPDISRDAFSEIVGTSAAIRATIQRAMLMSQVNGNVLLLGESGTGKEVFARAIHSAGKRRNKPFIAINCSALPRDLIVSELFGYEAGAFTGAKKQGQPGKFELANGGTLFLDEIGELPLEQQAMLLRVVEQKKITRLGSNKVIPVDIHIICATNADLKQMMQEKRFREDLYYRLGAFQLRLPPLRERGSDVVLLAEHFAAQFATAAGRTGEITFDEAAKVLLCTLQWHGNVRELRNLMEYVVYLYPVHMITREILLEAIAPEYAEQTRQIMQPTLHSTQSPAGSGLSAEAIESALRQCGGNRSRAAKQLGIARRTLYNYIERFGLS